MDNGFFSMDRLIEFGLSASIAQQMVKSMNTTMNQVQTPTTGMLNSNLNEYYYVVIDEKTAGPFSVTELTRLIENKKIDKNTYVWKQGMVNWEKVDNVPEILKIIALSPPPLPNR